MANRALSDRRPVPRLVSSIVGYAPAGYVRSQPYPVVASTAKPYVPPQYLPQAQQIPQSYQRPYPAQVQFAPTMDTTTVFQSTGFLDNYY